MSITKLEATEGPAALYVGGSTDRKIAKQNSRKTDTVTVRIPSANVAVVYVEVDGGITPDNVDDFVKNANAKNDAFEVKRYQLVGYGNLTGASGMNLSLTMNSRLVFNNLNSTGTKKETSLYVANSTTAMVSKQRQQSALSLVHTPAKQHIALFAFEFTKTVTQSDIESFLENSNLSSVTNHPKVKAYGIIGATDGDDITALTEILTDFQVSLTASIRLTASENTGTANAGKKQQKVRIVRF